MSSEIAESEIEINKYFTILERDLTLLKKDKANQNLRKKISTNLDLIPSEMEYFVMLVDNTSEPQKKTFETAIQNYQNKLKTFIEKFAEYTNTKVAKISAQDLANNPEKINEIVKKVNICDLNR